MFRVTQLVSSRNWKPRQLGWFLVQPRKGSYSFAHLGGRGRLQASREVNPWPRFNLVSCCQPLLPSVTLGFFPS